LTAWLGNLAMAIMTTVAAIDRSTY